MNQVNPLAIDPPVILNWLATSGLRILVILILAYSLHRVVRLFSRRVARRIKDWDDATGTFHDRRVETVSRLVNTTSLAVIGATATVMILSELSIDIAPVLASVGVVGLAFGLGAQTLVKDVISGFFLIVEGQYQIGDVVELQDRVGTVEDLTLRTTHVRDVNGYLHIIPNGEIRLVTNRLRDWSRAIVDVGVSQEGDLGRALQALHDVARLAAEDDEVGGLLLEEPQVLGVDGLEDWQARLRLIVRTKPNEHWAVQRWLRQQILELFNQRGIALAAPKREVFLHGQQDPLTGGG